MNGITINIDPVALRLAGFEIRWYAVIIVIAIIAATVISIRQAQKKGIAPDHVLSLLPWLLLGGILGARLLHVIDRWDYYRLNPAQIIQFQQGGLAIIGGVAGGFAAAIIYARVKCIAAGKLLDVFVPGLLTAQIIGRVACIINGDAYGAVTGLPWGFIYTNPGALIPPNLAGVPTHPYPLYEMLWNGISLAVLLSLLRRPKQDGALFLSYLALYSVGRFALTFVRQENIWFWGLQEAQVVSIAVGAAAVALLVFLSKRAGTPQNREAANAAGA